MKFSERWLRTLCDPPLSHRAAVRHADDGRPRGRGGRAGGAAVRRRRRRAHRRRRAASERRPPARVHGRRRRRRAAADRLRRAERRGRHARAAARCVGAQLPGGLAIKRATVRGVESRRHAVLGQGARHRRRRERPAGACRCDCARRTTCATSLALDDTLITLKLTPNRADCLSLVGIAREVAALTGAPLHAAATCAATPVDVRRRARRSRRGPRGVPALRGARDRRHRRDGADARVDEAAPRALAASARSPRWSTSPTT